MIEGIIQLGQAALKERGLLDNIIKELEPEVKGKVRYVFKLNFDTQDLKIDIDVNEEMSSDTAYKYCFVGSADGANSPQWYASSSSLGYFLNQTIYNLNSIDLGEFLNSKMKYILENFYIDLQDEDLKRFRYAIDLKKLGLYIDVKAKYQEHIKEGKKGSKFSDALTKEIEEYIKNKYDMKLKDFGIFVLCIDGIPLTDYDEYKKAVIESKKPKTSSKSKGENSVCHLCGGSENVSDDLTKTKIKFYTTNLSNFASELNKNKYKRNLQLCENCLNSLLAGETYLMNNLNTRLAKFNVYILPHFIYGDVINIKDLDFVKDKIKNSFDTLKNLESIDDLREDIDMSLSLENSNHYFLLNFIFYTKNQASTKVQRFIKDVNPSIFKRLAGAIKTSSGELNNFIPDIKFNLNTIYSMVPIRESKGEATEYRNILNIYDAILSTRHLDRQKLINDFCRAAQIIFRRQGDSSFKEYNISFYQRVETYINKTLIFTKVLEKIGCLKEGEGMDVRELSLKDDLKKYIETMKYDEQRTALFLLGYLIGEIGNAQRKRLGDKKPILNKINFNGIDKQKLMRLSTDVFNKLNQEKANDKPLRVYNEGVYYEFKRLIDKNLSNWSLNKNENLYYILSGYSYASVKPFLKEDDVNEQ
ncbi:TIGR02556 family CRISPR-associated protein [Caloramator proteoclasticus]|uniref:CRISPR-associated protein Csh1 n=1 Tax=Caloramator proteoclasticus DSM 10124 TaxID=1121262 RepID=A0A1M4YHM5_9CLOT|nr:TIGR02556 family CRISPR-associated protein [Caloramator proteoclasticus]SHF05305.1 CRISPR-associated protein Csh1 [Caloramator proteoclasticus DSM 10124]